MLEAIQLIEQLSIKHHAQAAYRRLLTLGFDAVPIVVASLKHSNAMVRYYCCSFLDHFLVPEALPALIGMLHDPDPGVRQSTLHTLACDRCKEGACRPAEADVLPEAIRLLQQDPDAHVRAMAIEVVGHYVHTNPTAIHALMQAMATDSNPTVRKKAGWYAPGGPIYKRNMPRIARKERISGKKSEQL